MAGWESWLYLATVIDLCTKEVVGGAMADHMRTELICDAITMAHSHRSIAHGAVFHCDYAELCVKPRDRVLACGGGVR